MMNISILSLLNNLHVLLHALLDHFATTASHRIRSSGVCDLSISDHSLIYAVRRMIIPRERPRIIETRNYKTFDMNAFTDDLKKYHGNC